MKLGRKTSETKRKGVILLLMKNQQEREVVDSFVSPSFSSYTSDKLADIADRVNRDYFQALEPQNAAANGFEFVTLQEASGDVFFDGYVGPVFPVFNRDLLTLYESDVGEGHARDSSAEEDAMALQLPMRKLLSLDEDRRCRPDPPSSSSSSSVDDFKEISSGTYCLWTPKCAKASPSRHKKSKSAGSSLCSSSKRWKFLDLLWRSNSDGKNSYVLLSPSSSESNLVKKKEVKRENSKEQWRSTKVAEKQKPRRAAVAGGGEKNVSAHEALYLRNKELKKGNKRRSYLPYRQDLIGFWPSP